MAPISPHQPFRNEAEFTPISSKTLAQVCAPQAAALLPHEENVSHSELESQTFKMG